MNKTLLLIEDDHNIREVLKTVLSDLNYTVLTAENGKSGLEKLIQQPIDLIISDIMMPVLDGLSFRAEQLKCPEVAHIPIIFLTADNSFQDKTQGLAPYEFLNKPINMQDLECVLDNFFLNRAG